MITTPFVRWDLWSGADVDASFEHDEEHKQYQDENECGDEDASICSHGAAPK
jgi:hypothetical protein